MLSSFRHACHMPHPSRPPFIILWSIYLNYEAPTSAVFPSLMPLPFPCIKIPFNTQLSNIHSRCFFWISVQVLHPYKTTGRIMDVCTSVYYFRQRVTRLLSSEQYITANLCIRVLWAAAVLRFFPPLCRVESRTLSRERESYYAVPSRSF
jgi:hypothetical protein